MASLQPLIQQLYPEQSTEILQGIRELTQKYAPVPSPTKDVSFQDVILITYGDGIIANNASPLSALKSFSDRYLKTAVSALHLLPFYPFSSDDGFSVIDYFTVNPGLGDWEDIKALSEHYELMFDAVVNHISKASEWCSGYLEDNPRYHDYFISTDPDQDLTEVVRPRALPLLHPYTKENGEQVYLWTTFSEDQVDLNYENPKVFLHVLEVLLFYVSQGARYIRLDAIAFLWKKVGTSCIHLPETHWIIQAYRSVLEAIAPNVVLITETNVPHQENISYFGNGHNEAHMVYNFTLPPLLAYSLHQESAAILTEWASSLELPGKSCFFNFTASHDGVGVRPLQGIVSGEHIQELADKVLEHGGFVSYKDNGDGTQSPYELNCNYLDLLTHPDEKEELRIQRFLLTQSVMLCMPGVPGVYYHSILGSRNDRQAAVASGIHRRINREKLALEALEAELKDIHSLRHKIFSEYSRMLAIRRTEPLFDPFGQADFFHEDGLFHIERKAGRQTLRCIHNFTSRRYNLKSKPAEAEVLYVSGNPEIKDTLGPFEFCWYKMEAK